MSTLFALSWLLHLLFSLCNDADTPQKVHCPYQGTSCEHYQLDHEQPGSSGFGCSSPVLRKLWGILHLCSGQSNLQCGHYSIGKESVPQPGDMYLQRKINFIVHSEIMIIINNKSFICKFTKLSILDTTKI